MAAEKPASPDDPSRGYRCEARAVRRARPDATRSRFRFASWTGATLDRPRGPPAGSFTTRYSGFPSQALLTAIPRYSATTPRENRTPPLVMSKMTMVFMTEVHP